GLLYPNDDTGRGEGHISYLVEPQPALPSGTRIENEATIVFDWNEPIETPLVVNTIDADAPQSEVKSLPATAPGAEFPVSWAGDDGNGSGISEYDVYVSTDGGPFELWLHGTSETSATFSGEMEHTYAFYSVAVDNVGHVEAAPTTPDAKTTVPDQIPPSVVQILVRDDSWNESFENYLESDELGNEDGYAIPVGSDAQLDTLPWSGIDAVTIAFSEDVNIAADDVRLYGVNTEEYSSTFSYAAATHTVTLTLEAGIAVDKLLLVVDDAVTDAAGNALDGDWEDGVSTVSGDATAGGDFEFRFNVLSGDVTNSDNVVAGDVSKLASAFGSFAGGDGGTYSAFVDLDGSGNVVAGDVSILASHFGQFLPGGEPALPANGVTMAADVQADASPAGDGEAGIVTAASTEVPLAASTSSTVTASAPHTAATAPGAARRGDDVVPSEPVHRAANDRFDVPADRDQTSSRSDVDSSMRSSRNGMPLARLPGNTHAATRDGVGSRSARDSADLTARSTLVMGLGPYSASSFPGEPHAPGHARRVTASYDGDVRAPAVGQHTQGMESHGALPPSGPAILGAEDPLVHSAAIEAVSLELGAAPRPRQPARRELDDGLVDELENHEDDFDRWSNTVDRVLERDGVL
ncbi:MAG: hypothetical protein R6U98_17040, partial [Pirellulaceae bacterium]